MSESSWRNTRIGSPAVVLPAEHVQVVHGSGASGSGIVVVAVGAVVAFATNAENGRADPVEVHATVTASHGGGRGSAASAEFRTDEGVEGSISGSPGVGERITIYRYGSGEYGWKPHPGAEPLWFAGGAAVLCLSMVVIGVDQVRKSMRRSRRLRRD